MERPTIKEKTIRQRMSQWLRETMRVQKAHLKKDHMKSRYVPASNFYEDPNEEPDFMTVMEVIPLDKTFRMNGENEGRLDLPQDENRHNDTVAASTVSPRTRAGDKKDERRYKFLSSGKRD